MAREPSGQSSGPLRLLGLTPSAEDEEKVEALWARYQERLTFLRDADVDDEEVAGVFTPHGQEH